VLLEQCDFDKRLQVENEWIGRFPWADLLNRRKRPPWWVPPVVRPPRIAEIDNYRRGHIFNVDGFRGVHYNYHADCYRVLVYNGRWVKWLEGDESVWDIRYIWFSDLARALDAQDNKEHFNRAVMEARRFKDIIAANAREQERLRTEEVYEWD
jgi:hypothetical protein